MGPAYEPAAGHRAVRRRDAAGARPWPRSRSASGWSPRPGIDAAGREGARARPSCMVALADAWLAPHGVVARLAAGRRAARLARHARPPAGLAAHPGAGRPRRGARLPHARPRAARARRRSTPGSSTSGTRWSGSARCSPTGRTRAIPPTRRSRGPRVSAATHSAGSGTPIGLRSATSPPATTARRTGAEQLGQPVAAGVAERAPGAERQPVGVGLDAATIAVPSAVSRSPSSQPRSASPARGGVPRGVVPPAGAASATPGRSGRPRPRARARPRRRSPATAGRRCARRRGARAAW